MPIAIWMPKYETGNPAVDRQHRRLFEMVNDLHHGIIAGHGRETMGPTLKLLASYTMDHFATEEGFMRSANYQNYARHKARHDELAKQVKELIVQFDSGALALPSTLSKFLADWLTHHIKEEDMEMITWLREKEPSPRGDAILQGGTTWSRIVSLPRLKHPGYTLEDWQSWEGRWELLNGVAYDMTPAPSIDHQRVTGRLHVALFTALEEAKRQGGGACEVLVAPVDVHLPSGVVQPDLLVVCDPAKVSARGVEGAPDLVVEVLSPSTAGKDVTRKRWAYEAAGVQEYLIVDPDERVGVLLRLEAGRYEEAARVEWGSLVALLGGNLSVILGEPLAG